MNTTRRGQPADDRHPLPIDHRQFGNVSPRRIGSVSLMLVLVLAMLVGAFAVTLSSRAAQQRRVETQHQSTAVLESAIATARQAKLSGDTKLRLPLDEAGGEWIVVERISPPDDAPPQYQATRYRKDQPGPTIRRIDSVEDKEF